MNGHISNQEVDKTTQKEPEVIDLKDWIARGEELFGPVKTHWPDWKFKCPVCGNIQTPGEFRELGQDMNLAYFNCIGRYDGKSAGNSLGSGKQPCNYTGGGSLRLNPVHVRGEDGEVIQVFDFAVEEAS